MTTPPGEAKVVWEPKPGRPPAGRPTPKSAPRPHPGRATLALPAPAALAACAGASLAALVPMGSLDGSAPYDVAQRAAAFVLALSVGLAAGAVWTPRLAWTASLLLAVSPAPWLVPWPLAGAVATAILGAALLPRTYGWGAGALLGFLWPVAVLPAAATAPLSLAPLLAGPVAIAWLTAGPLPAAALAGAVLAAVVARALLARLQLGRAGHNRAMQAVILCAGLALLAAAIAIPGAATGLASLSGGLGVAALVALAAAQGVGALVAVRAGQAASAGWPLAALGGLATAVATFAAPPTGGAGAWLGAAIALSAVTAPIPVSLLLRSWPSSWPKVGSGAAAGALAAGLGLAFRLAAAAS